VQALEHELQIRTEERENFKNKLQQAEKRITELEDELKTKSDNAGPMNDKERAAVKVNSYILKFTLCFTNGACRK